jgi:hypothetical protein
MRPSRTPVTPVLSGVRTIGAQPAPLPPFEDRVWSHSPRLANQGADAPRMAARRGSNRKLLKRIKRWRLAGIPQEITKFATHPAMVWRKQGCSLFPFFSIDANKLPACFHA